MSRVAYNSSTVQKNNYGCVLEFGEKIVCLGKWKKQQSPHKSPNGTYKDKALKRMRRNHIAEPLFEPANKTLAGFLLPKLLLGFTPPLAHVSTNNKQGKPGEEFHSGVVAVSALSKCCSCCQMRPRPPSSSPSLG